MHFQTFQTFHQAGNPAFTVELSVEPISAVLMSRGAGFANSKATNDALERLGWNDWNDCIRKCPEPTSPTDLLPTICVMECFEKF